MDYLNNTTKQRKHKHLNFEERMIIQIRLRDGYSKYKIAKELNRSINTISNEIKRGTVTQIKQGKKVQIYYADTGQNTYRNNKKNSRPKFKRLMCNKFLTYVSSQIKKHKWSVDACVGYALLTGLFTRDEMVCTKTIYNYIDLEFLDIRNIDLPMKLRRNTKPKRIRHNKRKLGVSITERPPHIHTRKEFGHWEIDTVIGTKSKDDYVLLTLLERSTRKYITRKIPSKSSTAVISKMHKLSKEFSDGFTKVFKSITSDNGLEFSELYNLESQYGIKVYFTHPYASYERGSNERHNGLLRRFIPKGNPINKYTIHEIAIIEDWYNTLPRKILGYKTPDELFEEQLDLIYAS